MSTARFLGLTPVVGLILSVPAISLAAPPAEEDPAEPPAELSAEQLETLRADLKQEVAAELRAELQADVAAQVAAEVEARRAEDRRRAEEEAAREQALADQAAREAEAAAAAEAAAKKAAENPLHPDGWEELTGKHGVALDKSTYKPGKGLHFQSEDERFALTTRLRAQMRYQLDADDGDEGKEYSHLFQIRRARLQFLGNAFNKHNKFKTEFAFSPRDLGLDDDNVPHNSPLLSWYLEFDYLRDFTVRMGQYKIPYSRQRVISSGNLQMVDRSLAQGEFNLDRDIGIDFRSKDLGGWDKKLRYYAGVYMGEGRDRGDKNSPMDFRLHYLARVEFLPLGNFKDYHESDLKRTLKPGLSFGASYSFMDRTSKDKGVKGSTPLDGGTTNMHNMNVDAVFMVRGFSAMTEFYYRRANRNFPERDVLVSIEDPENPGELLDPREAAVAGRNGLGWTLQAGYLIPRAPVEFAARYSMIRGVGEADDGTQEDHTRLTSLSDKNELGAAVSWYIAGHPLKLQGDYFHTWGSDGISAGDDQVRVQLQVAF